MACSRPIVPHSRSFGALIRTRKLNATSICPFCSARPVATGRARSRREIVGRRFQSTSATTSNPRAELEQALVDLEKHAPTLTNLSRLQLALQGLRQTPGHESVRVAILGLVNGADAGTTAKHVLRVMLADPLEDEQDWEGQLKDHDSRKPLIIRVGPVPPKGSSTVSKTSTLDELQISSAEWNGLNLEILFMDLDSPVVPGENVSMQDVEDALLVPMVNIPVAEDRVTTMMTPVHKALAVADGMNGAVSVSAIPVIDTDGPIMTAVNMRGVNKDQLDATFEVFDLPQAEQGVAKIREGPGNAMEYEKLWFASNLPALVSWLKSGIRASDESTKPAVRHLIASLLQNTLSAIQARESQELSQFVRSTTTSPILSEKLNDGLSTWAQKAHAELQDQLDLGFTGRRWRKLGWWQLFWRVDDVAMLTNEMLSQRFLPTAEQELVYLTGRIAEVAEQPPKYPQPISAKDYHLPAPETERLGSEELSPIVPIKHAAPLPKWPGHIAFTRRYLQNETIPALQALAQRLVLQSLGTSGVTTSLAALLYISNFSSTIYEAGAVAALGIMWSLGRLQKKWEAARSFWEGEVREEGRKALRAAEESVADVLEGKKEAEEDVISQEAQELSKARELVAKAEDALARMK